TGGQQRHLCGHGHSLAITADGSEWVEDVINIRPINDPLSEEESLCCFRCTLSLAELGSGSPSASVFCFLLLLARRNRRANASRSMPIGDFKRAIPPERNSNWPTTKSKIGSKPPATNSSSTRMRRSKRVQQAIWERTLLTRNAALMIAPGGN